ncbi:hypothetical protein [Nonomuraea soli]|uniref:DUF3558 domain-containing protein n=1 Tax=Nonomuraea soli TaxID=1032476 RepID=A0A7W0CDN0_9ACTN|nr:hypothetical protein [Nonomuraea soli]MBA2889228.1 hypothetical protein [Nonomuraea soli]
MAIARLALALPAVMMAAACSAGPAVVEAAPSGAVDCPEVWPARWAYGPEPGPLVPAEGVVSVTLCELGIVRREGREPDRRRTVEGDVGRLVEVLNGLPPVDKTGMRVCSQVGFTHELSILVRYDDGTGALVYLDRNCRTAERDGRTRRLDHSVVGAFLEPRRG